MEILGNTRALVLNGALPIDAGILKARSLRTQQAAPPICSATLYELVAIAAPNFASQCPAVFAVATVIGVAL